MTYLLDTNIVSELRKRRPDPNVLAWWSTVSSAEIFLSVITIGELRKGIELIGRKDPVRADELDRWLAGLRLSYRDHIAGIDAGIAEEWGRLNAPDPMPVADGLLAATARVRDWILVTRNGDDFAGRGVRSLDPFTSLP